MSARERVPRRGVSGRTHRSAPTRWGRRSEPTGIGAERCLSQRGGTEPAPYRGPEQGGGRVRLGCGFRQPNSETEFVASVKVTPPYGCNASGAKQRADVGIRPFSDGRGFGPPYLGHGLRRPNFVPKFGASVKSSAPTGPRDCRGSALSAERAAGQIRFLPDNIRVQHGVQRSEASAKPRPCSRRGCVN